MSHRFSEMGSDLKNIDREMGDNFGAAPKMRTAPAQVQRQTAQQVAGKFPFPLPASFYAAQKRVPLWAKVLGVIAGIGGLGYLGKKALKK